MMTTRRSPGATLLRHADVLRLHHGQSLARAVHRSGDGPCAPGGAAQGGGVWGFTSWHNVTRLVYVEAFPDMREAIAREKQIKGWSRAKTMQLIQRFNRQWDDLAKDWFREPLLTAEPKRPGP